MNKTRPIFINFYPLLARGGARISRQNGSSTFIRSSTHTTVGEAQHYIPSGKNCIIVCATMMTTVALLALMH